jgi:hypothetical protein
VFIHFDQFFHWNINYSYDTQGSSRVIISPMELKMQPTIHLQNEHGYLFFDLKNIEHSSVVNFDINVIRLVK